MNKTLIPEDIPRDEMGNVDVVTEMEYINILKDAGFDTDGIMDLLFADIEKYRRKRRTLIATYNERLGPTDTRDLSDIGKKDQDSEELLLLGTPLKEKGPRGEFDTEIALAGDMGTVSDIDEDEDLLDLTSPEQEEIGYSGRSPEHVHASETKTVSRPPSVKTEKELSTSGHGKRSHIFFYAGVFAVILIMIIAAGSYLYLVKNGNDTEKEHELSADFTISDLYPMAGTIVNLTAELKDTTASYKWEIQPENYIIISGDETMDDVELYFTLPGTYEVVLSVTRSGEIEDENKILEIFDREVTIERERYGDSARYDVEGHVMIENIDDMIEKKDIYTFETLDMDFWTEDANPMTVSITENIDKGRDGLAVEYDRLERRSEQFLRFSGTVSMKSGEEPAITGYSSISQMNHVDLFYQRSFRTLSNTITHVAIPVTSSYTIEYDMQESLVLYPSLHRQSNDFRIEDMTEDRMLSAGDSGSVEWGPFGLTWSADEIEIVMGAPSMKVSFFMDGSTKRELDIEEFNMVQWIADDIAVPVRLNLDITTIQDVEHPSSLQVHQQMISFDKGAEPVLYGLSDHRHDPYTRVDAIYPEFEEEFRNDWDMLPELGGRTSSIPSDIGPQTALDKVTSSREYALWSSTKTDLIVSYSNFSRFYGSDGWTIHIVEPGEEWGWKSNVTSDNESGLLGRVSPVTLSRSDLESLLTYSGAEGAMKYLLSDIDSEAAGDIYGKSEPGPTDPIRLSEHSISTRVDHPYPRIGLIDPNLGGSIPYCMIIGSFDGSLEVGLDMTNGQIAFIRTRNLI